MSSDLINKIMISALNFSKKIGDTDFIEKVLSILEPYYLESPFYLDLLEFQKSLYKKGSRNYLFALFLGGFKHSSIRSNNYLLGSQYVNGSSGLYKYVSSRNVVSKIRSPFR